MCIKIVKDLQETPYDSSKPLEDQVCGSELIVVNYEPNDKSVDHFLKEVERFVKTGVDSNLSIKVTHNDHIFGFKVKQKLKAAKYDISLNEIIKLMVMMHVEADRKLRDLVNIMSNR